MSKGKIFLLKLLIIFFLLLLFVQCFAEETLTITTYYPSPYGSYNELRSKKMGIGDTYYDGAVVSWDFPCPSGAVCPPDGQVN